MTRVVPEYLIPSWSGRQLRARKHHTCVLCDGVIVSGTLYLRNVVRAGPRRGKDPLRNQHMHLNCLAPWWQGEDHPHRLWHTGKLPHRAPTADEQKATPYLKPVVAITSPTLGNLTWQFPAALEKRLGHCPDHDRLIGAIAELEQTLGLVLEALMETVGHKRKARELSLLLNTIAVRR